MSSLSDSANEFGSNYSKGLGSHPIHLFDSLDELSWCEETNMASEGVKLVLGSQGELSVLLLPLEFSCFPL